MILSLLFLPIVAIVAIYTIYEGIREGYYMHYRMNYANAVENLHTIFTIQRALVYLLSTSLFFLTMNPVIAIFATIGIILIFSFIHNGTYFLTRNNIDKKIYPKRFFDDTVTPNHKAAAKLNIDVKVRTFMFIFGAGSILAALITTILEMNGHEITFF